MTAQFTPTAAELALVNQIFAQADTQKIGILTGDVAVRLFGGAKLTPTVLGEIWSIADEDNNGFLTRKGAAVAVRLIGWAQKGEKISQALLSKQGPLANIEGVHVPLVPQGTGMSIPKSPPLGLPPLTLQDKTRFSGIFQGCRPVNGLLSGDKARDMFFKSKLPVDKLSQIWSLADTQDRGMLDLTDFTIAMYLIQACMSNQLSFIPTSLPPGLYEQAGGAAVVAHATGSSAHLASPAATSFPPAPKQPPVPTNFTGQSNLAPTLPSRRPAPVSHTPTVPPFPGVPSQTSAHWDVTPAEKASADRFFDNLDSHKRGYIEGDVAVPFMLQSKLPEDVLAHVWDLADINNDGRLTRDGFAIAMHLIQSKISGKEIPAALPATLVPPSMRTNGPASPFTATSPTHSNEPMRDLLWDDSPPASAVNISQHDVLHPQTTGPLPSVVSSPPSYRPVRAPEDPFGSSTRGPSHRDLLGDDDETHSHPPLHDQSAEIGNLQNQVNSTNRSLQNAKAERETLEVALTNQAAQLSALQTQLASAKASFETETNLLNTLKERHANQNSEIQKVREELIRSESDLSAIRVEKAEIEGAFLRDKEEVRDLNRRMAEVNTQITATKQEVEKVRKDAKQQKGLLAIARKQLTTKESEKTKVDHEFGETQEDLANTIKEREEAEAEVNKKVVSPQPLPASMRTKSPADSLAFAAAHPLPITPDITGASPLSPSVKSNNPFERLTMSGMSTPRSQSPFRSFSTSPLPAPSLPPADMTVTALDDPFGISGPFDSEPKTLSDRDGTDAGASTPKAKPVLEEFGEVMSSPSDELFSTPPNGLTPTNFGGEATPQVQSLDSAAAHFPALDDIPSGQGGDKDHETDLSTNLHELDVDTDSDSDSDLENETPSQDQDSRSSEVPVKDVAMPPQAHASFDDVFGNTTDTPTVTAPPTSITPPQPDIAVPSQNGSSAFDAFGFPLTKPAAIPEDAQDSGFTFINAPAKVASKDSKGSSGISSFDEAFGKSSSAAPSQTISDFSFESAFEDNFDFGAPTGAATEQPPSNASPDGPPAGGNNIIMPSVMTAADKTLDASLPVNDGSTNAPKVEPTQARVSFDDAFSLGPTIAPPNAPQPEKIQANQPSVLGSIAFEEAFGGLDTSQALRLDDSFTSRTSAVITNPGSPPPPDTGKQFPSVSPATSPRGPTSPRTNASVRSGSPQPRATSPPPRVASPKAQRPSTSSSSAKEATHEKPAPPPRHSKISLRLPTFGKKKKQETMPPIPSVATPAVEEDVEPVKQLKAMGFNRDQAVAALEQYDYDVQRALNSLLGSGS